jgi:hypothetical protein
MVEEGQTEGRPRWLSVRRTSPRGKFRWEIAGLSPDRGCLLIHVTPREAGNSPDLQPDLAQLAMPLPLAQIRPARSKNSNQRGGFHFSIGG